MGATRLTATSYNSARNTYVPRQQGASATRAAEQMAKVTGKLDPLVDPAGFGVIRKSLIRFEDRPDGLYLVTVGLPIPIEARLDTTGSMGDNVEHALWALPDTYLQASQMLPDCDPQIAIGVFADYLDDFVLCRPQFEMEAAKIVHQLTLMYANNNGFGNEGEDPQYGLFGAAYCTDDYASRIGLKGYDFTITDEPARDVHAKGLVRVYGDEVFDLVAANGHEIDRRNPPNTKQIINDLLKRAHAFVLLVGNRWDAASYWPKVIDRSRIVQMPHVDLLPQVQASIIGLTEGTLSLDELPDFLMTTASHRYDWQVDNAIKRTSSPEEAAKLREQTLKQPTKDEVRAVVRAVANIPIGAQAALPNFGKGPKPGDVFRNKGDLWPMDPSEVPALSDTEDEPEGPVWGVEGQL